jgi:hypothetical protein
LTFNECNEEDRKGKVLKAGEKTENGEDKKCDPLNEPDFAYTDAATVNEAAVEGALALVDAIFGDPAAGLVLKSDNKDTAKCQTEMLKQANKLEDTILKEVNKAKKQALKDPTVNSAEALEAKLAAILSSNEKILKAQAKLEQQVVEKKCNNLIGGAAIAAAFQGDCTDTDLGNVVDCVIAATRCASCRKINAFDDLLLDCDVLDSDVTYDCPELDLPE